MRRRVLMLLLGLGVFFGYGGAIASASWHHRHHDCGRFGEHRWRHGFDEARPAAAPVAAPPQTVVVQPAAPAPAAAPQVYIIMPGASPQVVSAPSTPRPEAPVVP